MRAFQDPLPWQLDMVTRTNASLSVPRVSSEEASAAMDRLTTGSQRIADRREKVAEIETGNYQVHHFWVRDDLCSHEDVLYIQYRLSEIIASRQQPRSEKKIAAKNTWNRLRAQGAGGIVNKAQHHAGELPILISTATALKTFNFFRALLGSEFRI